MDLIGAQQFVKDFVLSGTCTDNLYGMCESLYRPNLVCYIADAGSAFD
jgi:20S proteasome subunit beta 3